MGPRSALTHFLLLGLLVLLSCGDGPAVRRAVPASPDARSTPRRPWAPPAPQGEDVGAAEPHLQTQLGRPGRESIFETRFTHDGSHLLVRDSGIVVYAFDHDTGALTLRGALGFEPDRDAPPPGQELDALVAWARAHPSVHTFDVSADDRWVVGGSGNGQLGVWKLSPDAEPVGASVARLESVFEEVDVVAFARAGSRILVGGEPARARDDAWTRTEHRSVMALFAFDPSWGEPLQEVARIDVGERSSTQLVALDVAADGGLAAVAGANRLLRLVDVRDAALTLLPGPDADDEIEDLRLTPDGNGLVTVGFDQAVDVWDVARDPPALHLHRVLGHARDKTIAVSVAADLRWLAASSVDGDVGLWPLAALRDDAIPTPTTFRPFRDHHASRFFAARICWRAPSTCRAISGHRSCLAASASASASATTEPISICRARRSGIVSASDAPRVRCAESSTASVLVRPADSPRAAKRARRASWLFLRRSTACATSTSACALSCPSRRARSISSTTARRRCSMSPCCATAAESVRVARDIDRSLSRDSCFAASASAPRPRRTSSRAAAAATSGGAGPFPLDTAVQLGNRHHAERPLRRPVASGGDGTPTPARTATASTSRPSPLPQPA
jgi:hypothetical protein